MKTIYTSNYARNSGNPKAIGISYVVPEWYEGTTMPKLAPMKAMINTFKRKKDAYMERQYSYRYISLLRSRNINANNLLEEIPDGSILLCYEAPGEFCHRRVLADWIEHHTGVHIQEWKNEEELNKEVQNKVVDSIIEF